MTDSRHSRVRLWPVAVGTLAGLGALSGAVNASAGRPVATYSIVARDPASGQLAVQSHWFSVGSIVSWAEPGVGAVATQSFVEPSYGPLGLALIRSGKSASQALAALLAGDDHPDVRQVAMVDATGKVAAHTGGRSIAEACDRAGEGFSVQANLMLNDTVCDAMFAAYSRDAGDLAERLMRALEAAQQVGGDVRGRQSAALLVVSGDHIAPAWGGRIFDHPLRPGLDARKTHERSNSIDRHLRDRIHGGICTRPGPHIPVPSVNTCKQRHS